MSVYVLVHGAWHGSWCWEKLTPFLEADGSTVIAPNLPGRGEDLRPTPDITLGDYVQRIAQVVVEQPSPVILVGHSHAGATISMVAELHPDKIEALVYVCAFLLLNRESISGFVDRGERSLVRENMVLNPQGDLIEIKEEGLREGLFSDCTELDFSWAKPRLVPEPAKPRTNPITVTTQNFGSVRRFYVECLLDQAIPLPSQRLMCSLSPCERVFTMSTSHSPFISAPEQLARHLKSI